MSNSNPLQICRVLFVLRCFGVNSQTRICLPVLLVYPLFTKPMRRPLKDNKGSLYYLHSLSHENSGKQVGEKCWRERGILHTLQEEMLANYSYTVLSCMKYKPRFLPLALSAWKGSNFAHISWLMVEAPRRVQSEPSQQKARQFWTSQCCTWLWLMAGVRWLPYYCSLSFSRLEVILYDRPLRISPQENLTGRRIF